MAADPECDLLMYDEPDCYSKQQQVVLEDACFDEMDDSDEEESE